MLVLHLYDVVLLSKRDVQCLAIHSTKPLRKSVRQLSQDSGRQAETATCRFVRKFSRHPSSEEVGFAISLLF